MRIAFRLLPYIYIILAGLVLLSMVPILLGMNNLLHESGRQASGQHQIAPLVILLLIAFGLGAVYTLNAILLLKKIKRKVSIILSIISCIGFPLGTIVGIVSLIVLTRSEVKDEYT